MTVDNFLAVAIVAVCYFQTLIIAQAPITVEIEHRFSASDEFTPRGMINIIGSSEDSTRYQSSASWSTSQQILAAKNNNLYCVRTKSNIAASSNPSIQSNYVMSCIPACALIQADLSDVITLSFDSTRQRIVSIGVQPIYLSSSDLCDSLSEESVLVDRFNTTVRLIEPVEGPVPETQAYLQKLEREKQEKVQGEQGDNRSFLAKYWMYIVPVLVVVMLSSVMNPEAAAQGR